MRESFSDNLRYALRHLYNPNILRTSPLAEALGVEGHTNVALALRERLVQEIEALKPSPSVPTHTQLWRAYEVLLYRYVQQCSQKEVSDQLGISVRHLRREQHEAIEVLAQRLRAQVDIDTRELAEEARENSGIETEQAHANIPDELDWLRDPPPEEPITLGQELSIVLGLVQPLASQHAVIVRADPLPELPPLAIHPVALRQVLLSLLSASIRREHTQIVTLQAQQTTWRIEMTIATTRGRRGRPDAANVPCEGIETARQILSLCGGSIVYANEALYSTVTLHLPAAGQVAVLVVDDHADTLTLLQRYVAGTRYRIVPCMAPDAVFALVQEHSPQVVMLDVMMPQMDGWELLGRLRQHPMSSNLPVVVCTVLPEKELALSLGANGFLTKPVTRESLILALDQLLVPAPTSH